MKMRSYKAGDFSRVREAIVILRQARSLLHEAGAVKAAQKVRHALKSAEGAERHVQRRRQNSAPSVHEHARSRIVQ